MKTENRLWNVWVGWGVRGRERAKTSGTHEDGRTVLFKTISLDGTKLNTNPETTPKTNPNTNTNPVQLFYAFFRAPFSDLQSSQTSFLAGYTRYKVYINCFKDIRQGALQS